MTKKKDVKRDNLYWIIYNNIKSKNTDWSTAKVHAVTKAMRCKVA